MVYKLVLPIYLWSINYPTLEKYIEALEEDILLHLDTQPIAEIKVEDDKHLWVKIDDFVLDKGTGIRLVCYPKK